MYRPQSLVQLMRRSLFVLLVFSCASLLWRLGYFEGDSTLPKRKLAQKYIRHGSSQHVLGLKNIKTVKVEEPSKIHVATLKSPEPLKREKKKIVILFTNKRSGSTFLGEMFNQNPFTFYLFEPLFPYTRLCNALVEERVESLRKLVTCDLTSLRRDYKAAFHVTNITDQFAGCAKNNLCFIERHLPLMDRYIGLCEDPSKRDVHCVLPVDLTLMSDLCRTADFATFKILRICDISTLESLFDSDLARNVLELKVIHLLRDPRAIMSSRMKLSYDEARSEPLSDVSSILCDRMENNIKFVDRSWSEKFPHVKYYRVRHEDVTRQPLDVARDIYSFIDERMPQEVEKWIEKSVIKQNALNLAGKSAFATIRKAEDVLNGWRRRLTLKQTFDIQEQCNDVIDMLGYVRVTDEAQLRNETLPLW